MASFSKHQVRRIQQAIARSYQEARRSLQAAREGREVGRDVFVRIALENVNHYRRLIKERRLALRLGRPVTREECA